jgi:hypothetical protein
MRFPTSRWLTRLLAPLPAPSDAPAPPSDATPHVTPAVLHGLPVTVVNTRPDIATPDVLRRLDAALALVAEHTPHRFRHLRRDVARVVVRRYPCRGAYDPSTGECLVELTFVVNPAFNPAQVAATIVHEGAHARLHQLGFTLDMGDRERQERFCRRAEIEFGRLVPGGELVVERALAILETEGVEVAPVIDARVAAIRVEAVDRAVALHGRAARDRR